MSLEPKIAAAFNSSPNEISAAPAYPEEYRKVAEEQDDLRQLYFLPPEYSKDTYDNSHSSECPLIVFVNSRSGGRAGSGLTLQFNRNLGRAQVFDLSKDKPDKVLTRLWSNFDKAHRSGDNSARLYQQRLRILVAGGDGTIAWVLGVLKTLDLQPMPPVAMIPMGTGNDLARTFGWGPAFNGKWIKAHENLRCTFQRIAVSKVDNLDCWKISLSFPTNELVGKFPYSLKVREADTNSSSEGPAAFAEGLFWNYMSVGLDAKSAFGFHSLRDRSPWLTAGRLTNQLWYSVYSCTSGWFCCTKPLASKVEVSMQRAGSESWEDVVLPSEVKALVVLNLQSYAGGRNLWGKTNSGSTKGELKEPSYRDGNLEVVGLTNGYHTGMIMATGGNLVHAKRLCQASGLRLKLKAKHTRADGTPSHAYLQVDGEPWIQDVPSSKDTDPITVEIVHNGVSKVLRNTAGLHPTRLDGKWIGEQQSELSRMPLEVIAQPTAGP